MKKLLFAVIAAIAITVTVSSCKKSSSSSTPTSTTGFVWSENGGANITADSAFYFFGTGGSSQSYLTAYKMGGTPQKMLEINLSGNTTTTFNIPSQGDFIAWRDTSYSAGTGGTVVVTSNTGGKASGTFDITFSSGTITHIKGSFTNIPVK